MSETLETTTPAVATASTTTTAVIAAPPSPEHVVTLSTPTPQQQAVMTGKSLVDCAFFLLGTCQKGEACRFR